jgi:diguanylate cyclase (GGDEF)-like protein
MINLPNLMPSRSTLYGFGLVTFLFAAVLITLLIQVDKWSRAGLELISNNSQQAQHISSMRDAVQKREMSVLRMINMPEIFARDIESIEYHSLGSKYATAREKLLQTHLDERLSNYLSQLDAAASYAEPYYNNLVEASVFEELSKDELEAISLGGHMAVKKVLFLLDKIVAHQESTYEQAVIDYQYLRRYTLIGVALAFVVIGIVVIFAIRTSTRQFKQISRLSIIDEVSGIYNRRYFEMVFEEEWMRSMREQTSISLMMVDIDYFKSYNDTYGHQLGDTCLHKVAEILSTCLKRSSDFTARYGGEEFAVVLPNTSADSASEIAQKLHAEIENTHIKAGNTSVSPWVTVSIGVSTTVAEYEQSRSKLVDAADTCLYKSKAGGRNRVSMCVLAKTS